MKMKRRRFITGMIMFGLISSSLAPLSVNAAEPEDECMEVSSEEISGSETEPTVDAPFGEAGDFNSENGKEMEGTRGPGWVHDSNGWRYYITNTVYATEWKRIDGYWYYFDPSEGYMQTGWLTYNTYRYYLETSGRMHTGWLLNNGYWFYFEQSGHMHKGWLLNNEHWYFFESSGHMHTGWLSNNGHWYYFESDSNATNYGQMVTGWNTINEYTYFFNSGGEFVNSTRRALIVGDGVVSSDLDLDGWYDCLSEQLYGGDRFGSIITLDGTDSSELCNTIASIASVASESDITYLCMTCESMCDENIQIGNNSYISGQALRSALDQCPGKVVLFLSFDYSGQVILRGETDFPASAFLSAFMENTRTADFFGEKYIVICSCRKDEIDANCPFNEYGYMEYSLANRWWMYGGGWDMLSGCSLQTLYADTNDNSIVTLNELNSFSSSHIPNVNNSQHVAVLSEDMNFTLFAQTNTK